MSRLTLHLLQVSFEPKHTVQNDRGHADLGDNLSATLAIGACFLSWLAKSACWRR